MSFEFLVCNVADLLVWDMFECATIKVLTVVVGEAPKNIENII